MILDVSKQTSKMPSFPLSHQHSSNVCSENSTSLPASNGNPFDTFGTQSCSQNGTSDHHSGTNSSTDFQHDFCSVHGSQASDQPASSHCSSSRSSGSETYLNSNMSNTNSIPLHQPSGSAGSTYPSHDMRSSSYHRPESLSMLNLQPMYEHDSTFTSSHQPSTPITSSHQPSTHQSIPSRIVTSKKHRYEYHDTLLEKISNTQFTLEQLAISNQHLMQRQSDMLLHILDDQAASTANQTSLLQQQMNLLQAMQESGKKRVPDTSHFLPNADDGISFDASSQHQPSKTTIPDDDNTQSVHSVHI